MVAADPNDPDADRDGEASERVVWREALASLALIAAVLVLLLLTSALSRV